MYLSQKKFLHQTGNTGIEYFIFQYLFAFQYSERQNDKISLKLFIGLSNEIKKSFLFREIPNYFKPSPLNFLYKFLKKDYHIDKNEIFFSFLDFDAY